MLLMIINLLGPLDNMCINIIYAIIVLLGNINSVIIVSQRSIIMIARVIDDNNL